MRQTLKLFILRPQGGARDTFIVFSRTMDLNQAKRLARKVTGTDHPDSESYDLPADHDLGKLSPIALEAYEDLIGHTHNENQHE